MDLSTVLRQFNHFIFSLLPISQTDDFDFVLASNSQFKNCVVCTHGFERSIEDSLALDFILDFFMVSRNLSIVALCEAHNNITVSIKAIVCDLAVFGLHHYFHWLLGSLPNLMKQQRFVVQDC